MVFSRGFYLVFLPRIGIENFSHPSWITQHSTSLEPTTCIPTLSTLHGWMWKSKMIPDKFSCLVDGYTFSLDFKIFQLIYCFCPEHSSKFCWKAICTLTTLKESDHKLHDDHRLHDITGSMTIIVSMTLPGLDYAIWWCWRCAVPSAHRFL